MISSTHKNCVVTGESNSASLIILANESPYGIVRWERRTVIIAEPDTTSDYTLPLSVVREQGTLGDLEIAYMYV